MTTDTPKTAHARLTATFSTRITLPLSFRRQQLKLLRSFLYETEKEHQAALYADLRKSHHEFMIYDLRPLYQDLDYLLRNLKRLARPKKASRELLAPVHVEPHPKGAMLIFGPFNFPTQLVLRPLLAGIAAGNVVCIKPSEYTPASERFLSRLSEVLDPRIFAVVTGGPSICEELLDLKWDHIMFTGSGPVGKKVMSAAAKFLTPVTLELGGKNPAVVTKSAHIPTAVASIVRGRFTNCGQLCLAPDYCLVENAIYEDFMDALVAKVNEMYTEDPKTCSYYGRLVSSRHLEHVTNMLKNTKGRVVVGGSYDDSDQHYVAPTVVDVNSMEDALMKAEIFGPVLPVMRISEVEEAIKIVNEKDKPLAAYIFCREKIVTKTFVESTRSGSVGVNETILQVAVPGSCLGGVGESGMGAYGFDVGFGTFSHLRPVMYSRPLWARILSPLQVHVGARDGNVKGWLETVLRITGSMPRSGLDGRIVALGATTLVGMVAAALKLKCGASGAEA